MLPTAPANLGWSKTRSHAVYRPCDRWDSRRQFASARPSAVRRLLRRVGLSGVSPCNPTSFSRRATAGLDPGQANCSSESPPVTARAAVIVVSHTMDEVAGWHAASS